MKIIKQNSSDKTCLAACAAMIFDTSIEDFQAYIGKEPPYTTADFWRYAASKNHGFGIGFAGSNLIPKINTSTDEKEEYCFAQGELKPDSVLTFEFKLNESPAIVVVKSESEPGMFHAVLWDGTRIIDPNPMVGSDKGIKDYTILQWFPIIKMELINAE